MRDFTTIPLHVICGVVIGYFLSLGNFSKDKNKRIKNFILAVVMSTIIHGTFNYSMTLISGFTGANSSFGHILLFQTLPLILIMCILFYVAIKFSRKTLMLNKTFANNETFNDKYKYLMNYNEYVRSYIKNKRDILYEKTRLGIKKKNK